MASQLGPIWRLAPRAAPAQPRLFRVGLHCSASTRGTRLEELFWDHNDPYAILGVTPTATPSDIKAAYRRAALLTHPDSASAVDSSAGGEKFKRVSEAYQQIRKGGQRPARRWRAPASAARGPAQAQHQEDDRPPWMPRHSVVGPQEAERLFRQAFGGRGVEQVMEEEAQREGMNSKRHGVHAKFMLAGLYARLLQQAQAFDRARAGAQAGAQQPPAGGGGGSDVELDISREKWLDSQTGKWFVRVRTRSRRQDGRVEESIVDKPVYRA